MTDTHAQIHALARRHGLGDAAGDVLFAALVAGGGMQAQFSHPELGGMGQWSGGMTQIGDMFNDALKAKVSGFCADASGLAREARLAKADVPAVPPSTDSWWPSALGHPASSGAQNDARYAFFPEHRRLALLEGGTVKLYDTGAHRLSGFGQQQGRTGSLSFSSQDGPVAIDSLRVVES